MLLAPVPDDLPFLREMLAVAAFPPGTPRPTDPLGDDHVSRYIEGWGRPGDLGLVAWRQQEPIGAAWLRLMPADRPGYGFVNDATPELTVAVVERGRGQGLGRKLVTGVLDLAAASGQPQVSLSVADDVNPAAHGLYLDLGFEPLGRDSGGSLTMVAPTRPKPPPAGEPSLTGATSREATATDGPALVRLRATMFEAMGLDHDPTWLAPFLQSWAEHNARGTWSARVVDNGRGRPVCSALAVEGLVPPAPGRPAGKGAHVSSVATEATWRRRGLARVAVSDLVGDLDRRGVESITLTATGEATSLYRELGFSPGSGPAMRRRR